MNPPGRDKWSSGAKQVMLRYQFLSMAYGVHIREDHEEISSRQHMDTALILIALPY
jgi:hypothetical protein